MHAVKTALRESFDNIHVGFLYSSKDETIKIETDRGKIGGESPKYLAPPKLLHDRISALGVMHVLHQECVVRLSSTLLLKNIAFH